MEKKEKYYLGECIAVTNQKGGCGKTTTVLNLGVALGMAGYKVLLIDIDKQINLTSSLIHNQKKIEKRNIGVILQNILDNKKYKISNYINHTRFVDVIAGNRYLYTFKHDFEDREDRNTVYSEIFNPLKEEYDFILFDCPPEAGIENVKAYTAATRILIVTEPTVYSIDGVIDAIDIANHTKQSTNSGLDILGIIVNRMDFQRKNDITYEKIIRNQFGEYLYVFDTVIPDRAAVPRSVSFFKSVLQHRKNDKASIAFIDFANELLKKVINHA